MQVLREAAEAAKDAVENAVSAVPGGAIAVSVSQIMNKEYLKGFTGLAFEAFAMTGLLDDLVDAIGAGAERIFLQVDKGVDVLIEGVELQVFKQLKQAEQKEILRQVGRAKTAKEVHQIVKAKLGAGVSDAVANSTRRYRIPNRIVQDEVNQEIERLRGLLKENNIGVHKFLDTAPTGIDGGRVYGRFNSKSKEILLFKDYGPVNELEELHHLSRAENDGYIGKLAPPHVKQEWEDRFTRYIKNLGVEILD